MELHEIFFPLYEFPDYCMNVKGEIRNKLGYVIKHQIKNNYPAVKLNGKQRAVHVLLAKQFISNSDPVATAFCPKEHETQNQVNHKNKNRADNRSINLEWVTPSANVIHAQSKHVARINDDGTMTIYDSAITAARQLIQEAQTNSRDIHVATRIRKCIKESFRTYLGFHWTLV